MMSTWFQNPSVAAKNANNNSKNSKVAANSGAESPAGSASSGAAADPSGLHQIVGGWWLKEKVDPPEMK
jgi:hypothetical protein